MSNHTKSFSQAQPFKSTFDIGDGPLVQSILALSNSSVLSICLSYLASLFLSLLTYCVFAIPTTLAIVESSPDSLQSLKTSDDRKTMPFDQEEKILAAFRGATVLQLETSARTTLITSSLRRTLRYWLAVRGKLGGVLHGTHCILPSLVLGWIGQQAGLAVSRQLERFDVEQRLSWYIPVRIALHALRAFIGIVFSILGIPLNLTWTWHLISWQTSNSHSRTYWPPLQRLMSGHGIWFLIRQMPLPVLPSKTALWHMFLPTLISFSVLQILKFYPESMIHSLFVKTSGANARPQVLVAAAILAEGIMIRFLSFMLPNLFRQLLIRIQASLLPEDLQPIVPMDRAFGLKHKQRQHPGITLMEAWETMSWDTLWRTLKMHVKAWVLIWSIVQLVWFFVGSGRAFVVAVQQHHNQRLML